jgi:glycosyltransferase
MRNNLKISVITATFNCEATIQYCIDSVINQTHKNIEYIIIDGGSTDRTKEIIKSNISNISIFISEKDNGIYDALNKGIVLATGDVVGFLHADDFYSDNSVLVEIAARFSIPRVDAVYGDLYYVSKSDLKPVRKWISNQYSRSMLYWGWMPPHPTLYVRSACFKKIGLFNSNFKISADYLFILLLFSNSNFNPVYIPRLLVSMRVGGVSNNSFRNILQKSYEDYHSLRLSNVGGILTLFIKNIRKVFQFF